MQKSKFRKGINLQKNPKMYISKMYKNEFSKIENFTKVKFIKIFTKIKNLYKYLNKAN